MWLRHDLASAATGVGGRIERVYKVSVAFVSLGLQGQAAQKP
jgi:hypothetical protein